MCKVNVELISKFIPIEIYPLFLKKRLNEEQESINNTIKPSKDSVAAQNKSNDLDTLSRFTNAFIDRIPDAKMSEKFKSYFGLSYHSFLAYTPISDIKSGNLSSVAKFVQSYFTCLSLVHKKLPTFTENLVADHFSKMLTIIQQQKNGIVRIGSLAALSVFSRNTNENFLEYLGNFVILAQISGYSILQKTASDQFTLLRNNYSVMFKDTGMEFTQILGNKLKKIESSDKIH